MMPEELVPDIQTLMETEGEEQKLPVAEKEEERREWSMVKRKWILPLAREDDCVMCKLLSIMFGTLGVMMWISTKLLTSLYSRQG